MRISRSLAGLALFISLGGCASTGDSENKSFSTLNGGDHIQEVRPDIFLIISKSGYYIRDEVVPLMLIDKLASKAFGQGPAAANKRWEARANLICGSNGYRAYKIETFSYSANTGPYPRWVAGKSAYAVCNRKKYSEADIKALFPDWK